MRLTVFGIGLVVCVLAAPSARADAVTLRTGDVLHGDVTETADGVLLEHEVLGTVRLAQADVASIARIGPVGTVTVPTETVTAAPAVAPAPVLTRAAPMAEPMRIHGAASDKGPWSHSFGLSMNTASGNTEIFNLEADAESRYEQGVWAFEVGGHALFTRTDGDTTAQHYHAHARVERKLDSRTYVFGQVQFDRDEIADLEYRINGTVGVGRVLMKSRNSELRGEIGAGLTHEKRVGLEETTDPSGWLALDYERTLSDGSTIKAEFDFLPNFGNFDLSVATLDVEYAKALSEVMSLVFGLRLEYVIDPPNAESLDTYFRAGIRIDI